MSKNETRLETDEEIRQAIARHRAGQGTGARALDLAEPAATLYRPTQRPPVPLLTVCDDGEQQGELIRIRSERFIIGRQEGDLILSHDSQISSKHAEIRRTCAKDKYRWQLVDLRSTNGTYVRVSSAVLQSGQEFLIGRTRYRFEDGSSSEQAVDASQGTRLWGGARGLRAELIELSLEGAEVRTAVESDEVWIGSQSDCAVSPAGDPFVAPRHAVMRRGADGRWRLDNNRTINGVWLRIESLTLRGVCAFQLGEQRFTLSVPG